MKVGSRVLVDSTFVPDYNGLTGEVIIVSMHPSDPTMPEQFKVRADNTPANNLLLESIGSPYVDLARPWEFWFVTQELREV
jgi:hypothetical protein